MVGSASTELAVTLFRRALQGLPNEPTIHRNLALAEEQRGHLAEAAIHYREALRLKPDDPQAGAGLKRVTASTEGASKSR